MTESMVERLAEKWLAYLTQLDEPNNPQDDMRFIINAIADELEEKFHWSVHNQAIVRTLHSQAQESDDEGS